ncbi:MAG: tetratricopeptide repeat protein [Gloeomargaritaceae cyanobacterium C42_A2020_066]|nr:tetratricopeptide repeat protein [Gloeomargaritaceae cyanobacterium C42_A2020_066]
MAMRWVKLGVSLVGLVGYLASIGVGDAVAPLSPPERAELEQLRQAQQVQTLVEREVTRALRPAGLLVMTLILVLILLPPAGFGLLWWLRRQLETQVRAELKQEWQAAFGAAFQAQLAEVVAEERQRYQAGVDALLAQMEQVIQVRLDASATNHGMQTLAQLHDGSEPIPPSEVQPRRRVASPTPEEGTPPAPQWPAALATLEEVLGESPPRLEDLRTAAAGLEIALAETTEPTPGRPWQVLAQAGNSLGDTDLALNAYHQAIARDPTNPTLHAQRAQVLLTQQRWTEALRDATAAVNLQPQRADFWVVQGQVLLAMDRPADVILVTDQALAQLPQSPTLWKLRGDAYLDLQQPDEALTCYAHAPQDPQTWLQQAQAQRRLKQYDAVLATLTPLLEQQPDNLRAWQMQADALIHLGRPADALGAYDRILALDSHQARAWNNRGSALFALQRYTEALAAYDHALALNPQDDRAWNNRGHTLIKLGRYDEALAALDQALTLNPDYALAYYNKAYAASQQGNSRVALEFLQMAIDLAPRFRTLAASDPDLSLLQSQAAFRRLVGLPEPSFSP